MNEFLAMPELMTIDTRREDGDPVAPPMRRDFPLPGPMLLPEPVIEPPSDD